MNSDILNGYGIHHPAPQGRQMSLASLFMALLTPPTAWVLQLIITYATASTWCFPRDIIYLGEEVSRQLLLGINLFSLAAALLATLMSYRFWRRTAKEAKGEHDTAVDAGEGRTRFLSLWGVWSGSWFVIQILFGTIAVFGAGQCGS